MSEAKVREAILDQARFCERSGSPITAAVLRAAEASLDRATATGRRVLDWPGNARGSGDSVPLRLAGGLHALARRGVDPALGKLYAGEIGDAKAVIAATLARFDAELAPWLDSPPQTNEAGRTAPIMAGLLVLAEAFGLPFELIELGASAGLNQNLDRFGYRLGTTKAGDPASSLQMIPEWQGPSPPPAEVRVASRCAVDQAPVDVADPAQRERLIAYVWPDQPERLSRIEAALALAADHPPRVERGDAADFTERALAAPHPEGVCRVVFHTVFWTYLSPDTQARIARALDHAAGTATPRRPLAWLRYELNGEGGVAELWLKAWPGGDDRHLATGHPHGSRIEWRC